MVFATLVCGSLARSFTYGEQRVSIDGFVENQVRGSRHSLALLSDGTVLAWGDNREGQLGLGSVADSAAPSRIVGLSGVTEIAAGGRRSLARSGSALLEWGDGRFSPVSTGADLSLASLGGEAGADRLGYGLGYARAFYAYDPQGNVRALTDEAGTLTWW